METEPLGKHRGQSCFREASSMDSESGETVP